jgi:hypothetical protein
VGVYQVVKQIMNQQVEGQHQFEQDLQQIECQQQ